jgi:FixJ family two-component response regulator
MNKQRGIVAVVEDDTSLNHALARLLVAAGFEVSTFPSAEALLANHEVTQNLQCVIADIELPGMSGLQLCKRLRKTGDCSACLIITAHDDSEHKSAAMILGASYLVKPFTNVAFIDALVQCMPNDDFD